MATKRKQRARKCLHCKNKAVSRGCCRTCLETARAVIRSGEKSDQELVNAGLLLPMERMGRPISSPFRKKLEGAK